MALHRASGIIRNAASSQRRGWLFLASALFLCSPAVEAQTASDGEKIVGYFSSMADGIGIELAPYSTGGSDRFVPTLFFPKTIWDSLTLEEQTAIALYLSAEVGPQNWAMPRRKMRPTPRVGALHPWYISLGELKQGHQKTAFEQNPGKEFHFEPPSTEGASVFDLSRLGGLKGKLQYSQPEMEEPGGRDLQSNTGETTALEKLLKTAVVVREPSTIFTAVLSQHPEYSDPESPKFGWESPKGSPLGTFRTGYIMEATFYSWRDTILVRLPIAIGNTRAAHARPNDVAALGSDVRRQMARHVNIAELYTHETRERFERYRLTPNTELLDPFSQQEIILTNSKGSIQAIYETGYTGAYGRYSIAKTAAGYFLGYARERGSLDSGGLTWQQARQERNWRFQIREQRSTRLQTGGRVFRLADFNQAQRRGVPTSDLERVMLKPLHFESLLRQGLAVVYAELKAPTDSGFQEPPSEAEAETGQQPIRTGYTRYTESVPETTEVYFLDWTENTTTLEISERKQERTVETWFNGSMIVKTSLSSWKRVTLKEAKTVENDVDGASRFTDGQFIYEVAKSHFGVNMTQYVVEESTLFQKN